MTCPIRLSEAGKTPLSQATSELAFFLTSALMGVVSLFLPICDFDEKCNMSDKVSDMTLLKTLGHSEFTAVGLFISIAAIFVVLGLSLTASVTRGKLTPVRTARRAGVAAEVTSAVGRIIDFIKMKQDDFPFNQLGMGFILFTVVGVLVPITGFVVWNTADRIEAENKASDFDAATIHGQGPAGEADQSEP